MKIGDVEKRTGLTAKTIRYYESRGLVQTTRSENQYRLYDEEAVDRLCKIKKMRELGIPLAEIRLWCDNVLSSEELLKKRLQALENGDRLEKKQAQLCRQLMQTGFSEAQDEQSILFSETEPLPPKNTAMFLGIDIGTTSLSAQVIAAEDGRCIHTYSFAHHAGISVPGAPDAFAADAAQLTERALALVASLTDTYPGIASIGMTGQMHGIVCLDSQGNILSPLYTWQNEFGLRSMSDGRTICQCIENRCGTQIPTGYGLTTYFALRECGFLPKETAKIVTITDLLAMRLCHISTELPIHPTIAASLGAFDLEKNDFHPEMLEHLQIARSVLPQLIREQVPIGSYLAGNRRIPVSAAIGDNQASVYGALSDESMVLINIGTSSQVSMISETPTGRSGELRPYMDGRYLISGAALCGGRAYALLCSMIRCIVRDFGTEVSDKAVYAYLNNAAGSIPREQALKVITQFCGTRTDPTAKGSITGIDLQNFNVAALSAGFLDGMLSELYELYQSIKTDVTHPIPVVSGNAMRRNPVLRELCGMYFGTPPLMPLHTEEAAYGAALYGAVCAQLLTPEERTAFIRYQESIAIDKKGL